MSLNKDLREKIGRSARKRALELYSFSSFDLSIRDFYDTLIPTANRKQYRIYQKELLGGIDTAGMAFIQSLQGFNNISNTTISSIISCMKSLSNDTNKETALNFFNEIPEYKYCSKGGLGHYLHCFPESSSLNYLVKNLALKLDSWNQ